MRVWVISAIVFVAVIMGMSAVVLSIPIVYGDDSSVHTEVCARLVAALPEDIDSFIKAKILAAAGCPG